MEAVATHGPVAVVLNAGLPPFKFYAEGVCHNKECHTVSCTCNQGCVLAAAARRCAVLHRTPTTPTTWTAWCRGWDRAPSLAVPISHYAFTNHPP